MIAMSWKWIMLFLYFHFFYKGYQPVRRVIVDRDMWLTVLSNDQCLANTCVFNTPLSGLFHNNSA